MAFKGIVMKIANPFKAMFDFEHILTPVAIELFQRSMRGNPIRTFKVLYIFGIRVAYWNVGKFSN